MKRIWTSVLVCVAPACGGLLDEGIYDVSISAEADQCGLSDGTTGEEEWIVSDKGDGKWSITFDDGGEADGKETGGGDAIVFHEEGYDANGPGGCWIDHSVGMTLDPDGDSFAGSLVARMAASSCDDPADDGSTCKSTFDVSGDKQ